jgi:hypothetical protein
VRIKNSTTWPVWFLRRKLNLAQTKVRKLKTRVRYYEQKGGAL